MKAFYRKFQKYAFIEHGQKKDSPMMQLLLGLKGLAHKPTGKPLVVEKPNLYRGYDGK